MSNKKFSVKTFFAIFENYFCYYKKSNNFRLKKRKFFYLTFFVGFLPILFLRFAYYCQISNYSALSLAMDLWRNEQSTQNWICPPRGMKKYEAKMLI